jgi:hypothetical protein
MGEQSPFFKRDAMSELVLTSIEEIGDKRIIRHSQDISRLMADNAESRKHTDEIWNGNQSIKPAAEIDMATFLTLQKNGIMDDTNLFLRWLERNPQYKVVNKTFARNTQFF